MWQQGYSYRHVINTMGILNDDPGCGDLIEAKQQIHSKVVKGLTGFSFSNTFKTTNIFFIYTCCMRYELSST